jgi:hypothetical protein
MSEVPEFLFLVTSTALVLGAAITIRGLLAFRPLAVTDTVGGAVSGSDSTEALPEQGSSGGASGVSVGISDAASDSPAPPVVRDLREPIVMTIAGVLICTFTLLGIAALIHNTY